MERLAYVVSKAAAITRAAGLYHHLQPVARHGLEKENVRRAWMTFKLTQKGKQR